MSRISRCNPITGIRLVDVSLPPSKSKPTAPVISAPYVDITISGLFSAIWSGRPLNLNLRLHNPTIQFSQRVVDGRKGVPISQWDPGIPENASPGALLPPNLAPTLARIFRYVQPGSLSVRNAFFILQPVDFQDYGHGDEVVHVKNVSADITFPTFSATDSRPIPIDMRGDFNADMKGIPVEGGTVSLQASLKGDTLFDLKPEDVTVNLHFVGQGMRPCRIASFLSLPFRADDGRCDADVHMTFLYKSNSLVPIMRGEATFDSVAMRFHPDPKTPEFRNIKGKLRFEGKTLFLDGPIGDLGILPMTVVGNIHLEDGYDLMGYCRPVDVNNVIETFNVDNFVPIEGTVKGEARMTGSLEEPVISGWIQSIGEKAIFDKLPLSSAQLTFDWDSIAGTLRFPDITAKAKSGGSVSGSGGIFFDMTKESPFDIRQERHSKRSPKAPYWNEGVERPKALPLPPADVMEIDEHAPFRQYDSMRFDFKVTDVSGGDLLRFYGGNNGAIAAKSIGVVSGEAILAGHLQDANCRVLWRSITPPPSVSLSDDESKSPKSVSRKEEQALNNSKTPSIRDKSKEIDREESANQEDDAMVETGETKTSTLGGGSFNGLVHLKLGDLPEARRVKLRTVVKGLDARRAGWDNLELRKLLKHSPMLEASADTFFKGVMYQRPILPRGVKKKPRTPSMELLGADGALVVKKLTLNDVSFNKILNGSLSFSSTDFSMSLKETQGKRGTDEKKLESRISEKKQETVTEATTSSDEVTVSISLKGEGKFCFRRGKTEILASLSKDEQKRQVASLTSKNVLIQDFVGRHQEVEDGDALGGAINVDMDLDLTSRVGQGKIFVQDPAFGPVRFSSVGGTVIWRNNEFLLEEGRVFYHRSEYHIDGRYGSLGFANNDFTWEVTVGIPRADVRDVAELIQNGNAVATAMQVPADRRKITSLLTSSGPLWLQKLLESYEEDSSNMDVWAVPSYLSLSEQVDWVCNYTEEQEVLRKMERKKKREPKPVEPIDQFHVGGDIAGSVTINYNSRNGDFRQGTASGSALLQAVLDQLSRTTFSFLLVGKDWKVGGIPVKAVSASGNYEDGVLSLGPFMFEGDDGFGAEARSRITKAGSVDGSVIVRNAPAALVQKYSRTPLDVSGEWSGRFEVGGNLSNPRALGRMVWTDATLNGKHVRDARTDMACVNGRCLLNVDAKIGSRRRSPEHSDRQRVESLNWEKNVSAELKDLASKASSKKINPAKPSKRRKDGRWRSTVEDGLQIRVSAPVRFYLLNYLRRTTPTSFWSELDPVLGGSSPSDDEWIIINADVKRYGFIFLNSLVPEVGWEGGNSDVKLRVTGSLENPIVSGNISVSDGKMSPSILEEPLQSVRGEVTINENGLISLNSISGRCAGRPVSVNGDMFVSRENIRGIERKMGEHEAALERIEKSGTIPRRRRQVLMQKISAAEAILERGRKGVVAEFGEIPVRLQKIVESKLSGRVVFDGVVSDASVGGWMTFSDGLVFVGNTNSVSQSRSATGPSAPKMRNEREQVGGVRNSMGSKEIDRKQLYDDDKDGRDGRGGKIIETGVDVNQDDGKEGEAKMGNVRLKDLNVSLGRGVKLVQPFVLNIEAAGSVTMNGVSTGPDVEGMIRLVKGKVNALALRMRIAKNESSYVRFIGREEWKRRGNQGEPEMLMKMVMENDDLMVRVGECKVSKWANNVKVMDKDRQMDVDEIWGERFEKKMEQIGTGEGLKRFVLNVLLRMLQIGGKVGFVECKVFPSFVTGEKSGNEDMDLRKEIGAGARVNLGAFSGTMKKSVSGDVEGKVQLNIGRLAKIRVGNEGKNLSMELELLPAQDGGDGDGDGDANRSDDSTGDKGASSGESLPSASDTEGEGSKVGLAGSEPEKMGSKSADDKIKRIEQEDGRQKFGKIEGTNKE